MLLTLFFSRILDPLILSQWEKKNVSSLSIDQFSDQKWVGCKKYFFLKRSKMGWLQVFNICTLCRCLLIISYCILKISKLINIVLWWKLRWASSKERLQLTGCTVERSELQKFQHHVYRVENLKWEFSQFCLLGSQSGFQNLNIIFHLSSTFFFCTKAPLWQ